MRLSYRLETVASFVVKGSNIADIGTDHGYIPIYLVEQGVAASALAMDVRPGPLKRAESHIREHKLEDKIKIRLSDGAEQLNPGEADTVIIAGMGGELVVHILEQGKHVWDFVERWILSPQSELHKVRRYLEKHDFIIADETMVFDEGKYYTVMQVARGRMEPQKDAYSRYGKILIHKKHLVLKEYLQKERIQIEEILAALCQKNTEAAKERCEILRWELALIKEVEDEMQ